MEQRRCVHDTEIKPWQLKDKEQGGAMRERFALVRCFQEIHRFHPKKKLEAKSDPKMYSEQIYFCVLRFRLTGL